MRNGVRCGVLLLVAVWQGPGVVASTNLQRSDARESLEVTLQRLERASWDAWKNRDAKFFSDFLTDDHAEIGAGGVADKAAVLKTVATPACRVNSYSIGEFHFVLLNPSTAVLTYRAEQDTTCNGTRVPSPAWATSVYVNRGGHWRNAVYQQTPIGK
jgi:hypothetical protein